MSPPPASPGTGVRDVLRLAWPAILSYILNNTYRINDQFWIQGLGGEAQAAIGASMFVQVMAFAVVFLAMGGGLARIARATGAGELARRNALVLQCLAIGATIGIVQATLVPPAAPAIVSAIGLEGRVAVEATTYLSTLYLLIAPIVLAPILDTAMIGMGNTLLPMLLQLLALSINFLLNPILIYGPEAAALDVPYAATAGALAERMGIEGRGIAGAAIATAISRVVTVALALVSLRVVFGVRAANARAMRRADVFDILRISAPVSFSIAAFAGVYWVLLRQVLSPLGADAVAGLGVGFQVFEGVSFPCYLGVAVASAALVGRCLGARDPGSALAVVRSSRRIGHALGIVMFLGFLIGGPRLAPLFSEDPGVVTETVAYVTALAWSQFFVASESVNEKVLMGAGHTRPTLWISVSGNLMRIPLAWLLAFPAGLESVGVWWAINLTTLYKAGLMHWVVQRRNWLRE